MNIAVKENKRLVFFIFLTAFFIRVLYIFQILQFPLAEYLVRSSTFDQYTFDKMGAFIAAGNWLGNAEVFGKEPLYSYFLGVIYAVFGCNHFAVYFIQAVLSSIAVVLLYKAVQGIFNRITAYIAAFIFAFYSISIFYDALLLRASLITFLNVLLFYLVIKALRSEKSLRWLWCGFVLGLSVLARQNMLFPFICAFILISVKPFKRAISCVSIVILGFFLVIAPVVVRNYMISEKQGLRISKEINAFWVGNTHASSGVDVVWSPEYHRLEAASEGSVRKMAGVFFSEIKKRPREYVGLYVRKIWMFLNGYEAPSNTNYYLYREEFPTILRMSLFSFRLVCALAIIGIFISIIKRRRAGLAYIFITILSASVILFHIQSRFRLPAVPFFIMFAAYAVYYIFEKIKARDYRVSLFAVATLALLYIILAPDLTYAGFRPKGGRIRFLDRTNLALSYIDDYEKDKEPCSLEAALRQCDLVLAYDRRYPTAYRIKGYVYFQEKEYKTSVREYKKAIIYDNRNPFLYNELAGVYFEAKDYNKAFIFTKRALRLFPGNKVFERNLAIIPGVS
ncbi:MAG: glycosyltransferase family 39 protein [Candidatus Omnitrophica bacterium]|nr:glycosyltransferase family 39 protein [Candidatus Omnitrophota bacterium]